jgi:predicted DNA-binding transcriptional regulator AlpA
MPRREITGKKPGASADLIERDSGPEDDEPSKRGDPAARGVEALRPVRVPPPRLALSIPEFAEAHGISEGMYYKLKKQRLAPREMKVGARTLITFEAAAQWRAEREAASAVEVKATEREAAGKADVAKAAIPAHPEAGRPRSRQRKAASMQVAG